MNRRTFIAAAAAGVGCAALPVVGATATARDGLQCPVLQNSPGATPALWAYHDGLWYPYFYKRMSSNGRYCVAGMQCDSAVGVCAYRHLPNGDMEVEHLSVYRADSVAPTLNGG